MRALAVAVALSALALSSKARADFVVISQSQSASAFVGDEPSEVLGQPTGFRHLPARTVTGSKAVMAQGFGNQVPLRFAVLQIVPKGVTVTYASGVSPDAAVDWTGGQSWPSVLARAVAPLHLRLAFTPQGVLVRK